MKKKFFFFLIIVFIFGIVFLILFNWKKISFKTSTDISKSICGEYIKKEVILNEQIIIADVSDTDCKREFGLSDRKLLKNNEGMLFVFEKTGNYGFWAKDMDFLIDIVWIGSDLDVVGIKNNVYPKTFPSVFGEDFLSKYVLELPASFCDKNNIKVGDKISISEKTL